MMIAVEMWKAPQVVVVIAFLKASLQVASCEYRGKLLRIAREEFCGRSFAHRREQYFRSLLEFSPQ